MEEDSASLLEQGERSESRPSGARARVSVTEESSSSSGRINSVAVAPPEVHYVIVGRGPAAVINHTTLRESNQGRQRIGDLRVMHIGFENPWPNYLVHGMGQPPYLLSLPGFAVQPNAGQEEIDGGLHSLTFGQAINNQLARLHEAHDFVELPGWVAWVQTQAASGSLPPQNEFNQETHGDDLHAAITRRVEAANALNDWPVNAGYRLIVVDPANVELHIVYAAYIDFCTGPGRPNVFGGAPALQSARTPPWLAPEVWGSWDDEVLSERRILNGVDAIVDQVAWAANQRICVTAGGGVGLNGAEKARNNHCFLDWFGRTSLLPTFDNPRNHTFLRHPDEARALGRGELDGLGLTADQRNAFVPMPTSINLRFGKGASLDDATNENTHVSVTLRNNGVPEILDFNAQASGLTGQGSWECAPGYLEAAGAAGQNWPSRNYDRLVIPNGQASDALGQPFRFAVTNDLVPLDVNGRMTALQTKDGSVRVLGAACQVYPGYAIGPFLTQTAKDRMWAYRATLPVSAVPDGFILSASNIATANGYFTDHPNRNINTMTRAEILRALPPVANVTPQELADAIVGQRNRANGYANYDALMAAVNLLTEDNRGAITAAFRFDYT